MDWQAVVSRHVGARNQTRVSTRAVSPPKLCAIIPAPPPALYTCVGDLKTGSHAVQAFPPPPPKKGPVEIKWKSRTHILSIFRQGLC